MIIGSGPAGLSAAVYAARSSLKFTVIEKEYLGTGQIAESERVDNYLGLYGENGFDLGEKFRQHAKVLGTQFTEGEVVKITPENGGYNLELADGGTVQTRTVIYAAGASHRRLDVSGSDRLSGKGISYCAVCDGAFYKDKTVAVIGGGDTALGDAVYLSGIAKKVYLIHRRDTFRANKRLCEAVAEKTNIETVLNATLTEIFGEKRVKAVGIQRDGKVETLDVDGVFVAIGTIPNSMVLKGVAELSPDGYVIAGEDCKTSAAGIFAAGDVRTKALRQIATAVADGANSVLSAEKYLTENR